MDTKVNTVYKILVEREDETLCSFIAGGNTQYSRYPTLTYKEGEITYAPEDSMGIFTHPTLDRAVSVADSDKRLANVGKMVIHEATALGNGKEQSMPSATRYPAVLLGKRVWEAEDEEPHCEVGDVYQWMGSRNYYQVAKIGYDGRALVCLGQKMWYSANSSTGCPEQEVFNKSDFPAHMKQLIKSQKEGRNNQLVYKGRFYDIFQVIPSIYVEG